MNNFVKSLGFGTFLPQVDGSIAFDRIKVEGEQGKIRKEIFDNDVRAIKECDILLALLDGRVPDEGMCIELGIACALGKKCVGYKTDQRSLDEYGNSLMIEGCLFASASTEEGLKKILLPLLT